MRVLISAEGDHSPKDHQYMVVDNHGILIDLSKVDGNLIDPTISRVEWGMRADGNVQREGGVIVRRDGGQQKFWDKAVLEPYLEAYYARRAELAKAPPLEAFKL